MSRSRPDTYLLLGLPLAVGATVPVLSGGGFDDASQSTFVALAGVILLTAGLYDQAGAARATRSPLALALLALGALSAASVIWTIGSSSAALRWGLVVCGYGAVLIGSATFAERRGPWPVAAGIAGLALVEAVIGLHAVAFHALPDAERIVRAWEPGGTFEYPPALAILQVGALPILAIAVDRAGPVLAGVSATALILAGAVLRLADSRLALALAALAILALILRPPPGHRSWRSAILSAVLVVGGGLLAPTILGGDVARTAPGAGGGGLAEILGLAIGTGVVCSVVRRWSPASGRFATRRWKVPSSVASVTRPRVAGFAVLIVVVGVSAIAIASAPAQPRSHPPTVAAPRRQPASDLLHGRSQEWLAAIETWLDRPILGAGTESYYMASLPHQTVARSLFAHDLPLELAAELGVLGLGLGLLLYLCAGWTVARALETPHVWLVGPLVVAFLMSNLFDWTWHLAGLGAVWAAACGALTAAHRESKPASRAGTADNLP